MVSLVNSTKKEYQFFSNSSQKSEEGTLLNSWGEYYPDTKARLGYYKKNCRPISLMNIDVSLTEYLQTKFNSTLRLIHMIKWDLSWDTKMVVVLLWKSLSCLTLCNPVHGILQARILEWVAFSFSRGSSQPRDQTQVSCIARRFFTSWATREAHKDGSTHTNQ